MEKSQHLHPYGLIDLHCDTLTDWEYASTENINTLDDPKRMLSLSSIPHNVHWAQFYAIFIPDDVRGQDAIDYFTFNRQSFYRQMELFKDKMMPCRTFNEMALAWNLGKHAAFLTVENGSALAGDIRRVKILADEGVKAMTLVWNGKNELGSGHDTSYGLSAFGKCVIPEMERQGVIVDVSHLNDAGFEDLLAVARKPFIASHSNARAICTHKRNLTDDMIGEMIKRDCLIGLNYVGKFIRDDGQVDSINDLYAHVEHFLQLGAENNLALGSDFDGAALPECLSTPRAATKLYQYFMDRGLTQGQAEKIIYKNAQRFFQTNMV